MYLNREENNKVYLTCDKCKHLLFIPSNLIISKNNNSITFKTKIRCPNCKTLSETETLNYPDNIQILCPKCGSAQIQAVPQKWSLLTGILTNKINRVCLNCKHKF